MRPWRLRGCLCSSRGSRSCELHATKADDLPSEFFSQVSFMASLTAHSLPALPRRSSRRASGRCSAVQQAAPAPAPVVVAPASQRASQATAVSELTPLVAPAPLWTVADAAAMTVAPAPTASESGLPEGSSWRYSEFINAVQRGKVERVRFAKDGSALQLTAVDGCVRRRSPTVLWQALGRPAVTRRGRLTPPLTDPLPVASPSPAPGHQAPCDCGAAQRPRPG